MWLDNKKVMIIGGTGTIGKTLLKKLLGYNVSHIYIFTRDEQKQDAELHYLRENSNISYIIGDIRNYDSINSAMRNIDVVFHTAAMKIVRICEYNPYEALKTNVIGTQNVIRSAMENRVEKLIFTSSDKAANPTTAMGIGKLYAERLISYADFTTVRFGNVVGSRGCVLDLFKKQIERQNYVTVTHPDMTRFICTIDEAVELVLNSGEITAGGEIFIKKMPSIRIIDLAQVLINYLAPKFSKNPDSIKIRITGKQTSEKLFEELVTEHEAERAWEFDHYYCILPTVYKNKTNIYNLSEARPISREITSNTAVYLTQEEILEFLLSNKLI